MTYLGIALLCLAIVPGSFSNKDMIHKYMTLEEVEQVFHTDYDSVPRYEIVRVHLSEKLHKRDLGEGRKMHIRAFGQNINLWLHPSESILAGETTPVFYARYSSYSPVGVEYWRRDGLMGMVGRIFEDPQTLASLVIGREESGRTRVNGYVESKNLAIRSLPSRVAEEYRRRRRSVGDFDDLDSPYHVVFDTNEKYEDNHPALPVNETILRQMTSQLVAGTPDILYPEIQVVVEHSMYRVYGRDIYGLLEYLLAFWNGVDLKYRSLESPRVRFHISSIILSEDSRATPYISKNSLSANAFNSSTAMNDVGQFWYSAKDKFPLDSYDMSVTMTMQDFGLNSDANVLGKAFVGHACSRFESWNTTLGVTIIKDNGAFMGVFIAAHEIGHLLGARHDATKGECIFRDGFIMSFTPWYTKNSSDFSSCSTQDFNDHLNGNSLDCLLNRPEASGKSIPRLMPGRLKNLEEQCKALNKEASCQADDICVSIHCLDEYGECIDTGTAAIDGTSCVDDDTKFCLHMQCVSL